MASSSSRISRSSSRISSSSSSKGSRSRSRSTAAPLSSWSAVALVALGIVTSAQAARAAGAAATTNATSTTSLSQAVGDDVAKALGPANLDSQGWSWAIPTTNSSSTHPRRATSSAENWAKANLNLYNNRFAANPSNFVLTTDPAGSDEVLSVKYAAKSYGLHTNPSGGTSFYPQPFLDSNGTTKNTSPYVLASNTAQSSNASDSSRPQLLLTYSVYFPDEFQFVQGGKLPGLYSSVGAQSQSTGVIDAGTSGCEGGSLDGTGTSCWSARIMWREGGQGEVYVYLPQTLGGGYKLCPEKKATAKGSSIICNKDYGLSLGRGSFTFKKGSWNQLALYIQVNEPNVANGQIQLFTNGDATPTIRLFGVVFRSGTENAQNVKSPENAAVKGKRDVYDNQGQSWVDKIMWTSFFGGNTKSYATPIDTQTYFKDVALFAGDSFATEKGRGFTLNAAPRLGSTTALAAAMALVVVSALL